MIEQILDECLELIRNNQATIQECLAKYPECADELEPLLEMALSIEELPDIKPSQEFKERTRSILLQGRFRKTDGKAGDYGPPDAVGHVTIRRKQ